MGKAKPATKLGAAARAGDLRSVQKLLAAEKDEDERDVQFYQWLCVAADFGHAEASEMAEDLLESSSLRYDDDQVLAAHAHFEVACWHLGGRHGLPIDLDKGASHLRHAKALGFREKLDVEREILEAHDALRDDAQKAFAQVFRPRKKRTSRA